MRRVEIGRRECEPDRALAAFIELRGDPLPEGPSPRGVISSR